MEAVTLWKWSKRFKTFQHYYYDILSFYESFVNLSLSSLKTIQKF